MSRDGPVGRRPARSFAGRCCAAAVEAIGHADAPYSRFRVDAAARRRRRPLVVGCNVENAATGGAVRECGLVGSRTHHRAAVG